MRGDRDVMAEISKIIGIAFITAITAVILRGTKPELSH